MSVECQWLAPGISRWQARQPNNEGRAVSGGALDVDFPAVTLDDVLRDAQAKAASRSVRLGGEEWLEDPLCGLEIQPLTVIDHANDRIDPFVTRQEVKAAARLHRLASIGDQVDEDLRQIALDRHHLRKGLVFLFYSDSVVVEHVVAIAQRGVEQSVELDPLQPVGRRSRVGDELSGES